MLTDSRDMSNKAVLAASTGCALLVSANGRTPPERASPVVTAAHSTHATR
jgi:hypothetical protein